MKKLSLYLLVLLVFMSCGKTGSNDKTGSNETYLEVLSVSPTNSQKDANIYDPINITFNEKIKEVNIALIDTKEDEGQVDGVITKVDDKVTFTPTNNLEYSTYKVNIYKEGTISSSDKKLKENYSYTFTTYPQAVNGTPDTPKDKEEEKEKEKEENTPSTSDKLDTSGIGLPADTDKSYSCKLVPC